MTDAYAEFKDEKDPEDHQKSVVADATDAQWTHSTYNGVDKDDDRLTKLDYQFRKEPIKTTLKIIFPHYRLISITSGYVAMIIFFYILTWIMYQRNPWKCVIYSFGSNYTPGIQRGHIQRLFMPGFLHNTIWHMIWNCFAIISIGSNCEYYLGTLPYL